MGFVWEILYGELELQGRQEMVVEQLKKAGQIKDSLLLSFKADFTAIFRLECVQSGALDDLPLSVANGDMNPTKPHGDRARRVVRFSRLGVDAYLAVGV